MTPIYLFLLLVVLFKFVASSGSEEEEDDFSVNLKDGHSSDDEDNDSVHGAGLEAAFANIDLSYELSGPVRTGPDSQLRVTGANGAVPLSCLDGNGAEVDWWFVYKEPDGKRYLYLSSLDVASSATPATFLPLRSRFLIDDPETSPVIKTIYHPRNRADSSEVWVGWNDQPSDDVDAYGARVCGVKHAHSKGFYAQNAIFSEGRVDQAVIGSYAILTSLPQFPQIAKGPYIFGGALNNQLPRDPSKIFGSNLSANAQHFMCLSFPRENVRLERDEAGIFEVPVVQNFPMSSVHLNFLARYLKTIHPAIVGTNFADENSGQWIWRRYFSLLRYSYPAAYPFLSHPDPAKKLLAYSTGDLPSLQNGGHFSAVFPLATSQFIRAQNGKFYYDSSTFSSRWDARFAHQNGCIDGTQAACLQSFKFETTNSHSPLKGILFAKHGMVILDLFDDWAALQVAEAQKNAENYYAGQTVDRYGLLVQSWIDSKTVLPRNPDKKIYNEDGKLVAKVHIDNVAHFHMPLPTPARPRRVETSHKDHSKWAISFALDTFNTDGRLEDDDATFSPLVFVADLNRATTQARLKGKTQGRGGGIVAISSFSLWHALTDLGPRSYRQRFATSGKTRTRQLQNRLRTHTSASFVGLNQLPVVPLRKFTFKALRLSRKEARKPVMPVRFVSVLNEISKFIKMADGRSEHAAIAAFQRLFRNISEGNVLDAARTAWDRTRQQLWNHENSSGGIVCVADWPKLFTLPSLQLYREIPESREDDPDLRRGDLEAQTEYIIIDQKTAGVSAGDIFEVISAKIHKQPRTKETQTGDVVRDEHIEATEDALDAEDEEAAKDEETVYDESSTHDEATEDEEATKNSDDHEDEDESEKGHVSDEDRSGSEEDHSTEYADHINRQHRENDGEDYNSDGYESP